MADIGDTKAQCQYCTRYFMKGSGLTNHERGCPQNPARRTPKRRQRKLCDKCRTLVDAGNFRRHYPVCKGRRDDHIVIGPVPPLPPEVEVVELPKIPLGVTPAPLGKVPSLPTESTSELLVELLFPNGVMPTHPEFVRAFRAWLDATDKLVAIAGMDS